MDIFNVIFVKTHEFPDTKNCFLRQFLILTEYQMKYLVTNGADLT
ncbi:4578_t:CDS:2 [Ambispora gerdemannii]|uniref:4578_t:CDS:1 n=1 Tax=Ambispora gerdemannii TaxID=144530 RepID=A0A9N9FE62_9GLOM|nr:4578_t:CDS:2 [Ambispora gerdemannii]